MMKKSLSVVLAVLLAGSTSLAVAQTSAEVANASSSKDLSAVKKRFADQFASFQDISDGKAPAWSLRKPTFSNAPAITPRLPINVRRVPLRFNSIN